MGFVQRGYGVPVGDWTTGCCGCHEDCGSMCCAMWCPCVIVGRNAEIVSDGMTSASTACCLWFLLQMIQCGCLYSMGFRNRLRQKYVLPSKPCNDCCMHWLCLCCSISQEYRELQNRGWNPRRGYAENMRLFQAKGLPPPPQNMTR